MLSQAVISCGKEDPLSKALDDSLGGLIPKDAADTLDNSLDEVEKLTEWEYTLQPVIDPSLSGMKDQLSVLGKERWECTLHDSNNHLLENQIFFYCKRRPKSALRYLPALKIAF